MYYVRMINTITGKVVIATLPEIEQQLKKLGFVHFDSLSKDRLWEILLQNNMYKV